MVFMLCAIVAMSSHAYPLFVAAATSYLSVALYSLVFTS